MEILMVFNNNVVIARDELGRDVVVTGRGIGFQRTSGDVVDPALVVRRFVPDAQPEAIAAILVDIPTDLLAQVTDLFASALRELGSDMPPLAVIAIADHVHQAMERHRAGIAMEYPMRAEVAHLHPEELRVAERFLARLNSSLPDPLPDGEAIALAMHLFHAVTGNGTMSESYRQSAVLRQVFELLRAAYGPEFDESSVDAARFAAHLRYFFARARSGRQLAGEALGIGAVLREQNPRAHQLAQRVRALLELRLGQPITEDETVYLTLHLARLEMGMRERA